MKPEETVHDEPHINEILKRWGSKLLCAVVLPNCSMALVASFGRSVSAKQIAAPVLQDLTKRLIMNCFFC